MPTFKAPQYTKTINSKTGANEPSYTFPIEFQSNEEGITFVAEEQTEITLQILQKYILENVNWWNTFIGDFLKVSSKLFAKSYTIEQINKIVKHTLEGDITEGFPANVIFLPRAIQIVGGVFIVKWIYKLEAVVIDIPDLTEQENNTVDLSDLPVPTNEIVDGIEELNIDELPIDSNSTDEVLKLDSPAKFYEKQRVKEARLKAKLAVYKAHRQMAQYYEKYGDDISDSDSDFGSTDGEYSEEEVQL